MHRLWRLFSCPLGGALAVACVLVSLATHPADGRAGGVALHESSARRAATAAPAPGPMLRTVQLPAAPSDMLVDERTQRVFVICGPGLSGSMTSGSARSMVVLDAATGRLLRTISLGAHVVLGGLAVDPQSGRVFLLTSTAGTTNGQPRGPTTLRILDGRTGTLVRRVPAGLSAQDIAVDARRHRLFILDVGRLDPDGFPVGNATLRVLATPKGTLQRLLPVRGSGGGLVVDARTGRLFLVGGPGVLALDEDTGAVRASVPVDTDVDAGPLLIDERAGRVLVAEYNTVTRADSLDILHATTGAVLHTSYVGTEALAVDSAIGHGVGLGVTESSSGGPASVDTFETQSGRTIRTVTVASGVIIGAIGVDARRHRAAVVTWIDEGPWSRVSDIDTRSGRLLRQVQVGRTGLPMVALGRPTVAVDEQTARIFVAYDMANTVSVLDPTRL